MIQKMMIEIESKKPISEYGDGHIIVYNSAKRNYYVQSREDFLKDVNQKLDKVIESFSKLEKQVDSKEKTLDKKYEDFLKTYQTTNAKMIEMIEKVVNNKEEYV